MIAEFLIVHHCGRLADYVRGIVSARGALEYRRTSSRFLMEPRGELGSISRRPSLRGACPCMSRKLVRAVAQVGL